MNIAVRYGDKKFSQTLKATVKKNRLLDYNTKRQYIEAMFHTQDHEEIDQLLEMLFSDHQILLHAMRTNFNLPVAMNPRFRDGFVKKFLELLTKVLEEDKKEAAEKKPPEPPKEEQSESEQTAIPNDEKEEQEKMETEMPKQQHDSHTEHDNETPDNENVSNRRKELARVGWVFLNIIRYTPLKQIAKDHLTGQAIDEVFKWKPSLVKLGKAEVEKCVENADWIEERNEELKQAFE